MGKRFRLKGDVVHGESGGIPEWTRLMKQKAAKDKARRKIARASRKRNRAA
jgi:hypothetical protein